MASSSVLLTVSASYVPMLTLPQEEEEVHTQRRTPGEEGLLLSVTSSL